jgi:membrane protease YdiL (CAAX protease family)
LGLPDPMAEEPPDPAQAPPAGRLYRLAWLFYLCLAIAGSLWIGLRRGPIPLRLFLDPARWFLDAAVGAAAGLALLGFWEALRRLLPAQRRLEERLGELLGGLTAPQALALAALSGFAEELFFRGAVQGAVGWLAASLLFALLHSGPGPEFRLWTLFAACAGLLFGALMLWRGNLLAPALAHFLVNAVNLRRLRRGGAPPA